MYRPGKQQHVATGLQSQHKATSFIFLDLLITHVCMYCTFEIPIVLYVKIWICIYIYVCVYVCVCVWVGGCKVNKSECGFPRQGKAACIFAFILYLCFAYLWASDVRGCCVNISVVVVWSYTLQWCGCGLSPSSHSQSVYSYLDGCAHVWMWYCLWTRGQCN